MTSDSEPSPENGDPRETTRTIEKIAAEPGAIIGPYRLLRPLGEGGMGVVYHAQQLYPIRREVALKIIKPGMDSKQVIARFESERQTLAMMDHGNIARVFDAGTTTAGLPYFVMELVDGIPINRYCDSKRLTIRERIDLFIAVCKAIRHAHQKGIIHRDIKPSNVLVMEQEGKPTPKVIDFGLAKALGDRMSDATMMTNLGTVVGTLEYMSPEQAELSRQDIDTRSDIYCLGVLLYELLTGATPLDHERLTKAAFPEVLRSIREEEPVMPSARARRSATSAETATRRRTDPLHFPGLLHGELDWITMKALEKDRTRRYETVNGFARDLERYLDGEPVEAAPPSIAYRLGKFMRKHWAWLATAAAFTALLVAGTAVSLFQASLARQRFQQVRKLAGRFIELHDDVARLPGSTKVREKMVATALDYLDKLSLGAGDDADLLNEIGQAYRKVADAQGAPGQPNLGRTEDALASFRKAIEFEQRAARIDPAYRVRVATVEAQYAYLSMLAGHLTEARQNLDSATALLGPLRAAKPEDPDILLLAASVAMHQGDLKENEGQIREQLAFFQQARELTAEYACVKQDNASRARLHLIMGLEATALTSNQRYEDALAVLHQGEPLIDSLLAAEPDNPAYLRQKMSEANYIGHVYDDESGQSLNKPAEAVAADRRYVALAERIATADPNNASGRLSLAIACYRLSYPLGKINPPEALQFVRKALGIFDAELARTPNERLLRSRRARCLRYLAYAQENGRHLPEALEAAIEAASVQRQLLNENASDSSEREQLALTQKVLDRVSKE